MMDVVCRKSELTTYRSLGTLANLTPILSATSLCFCRANFFKILSESATCLRQSLRHHVVGVALLLKGQRFIHR